MDSSRDEAAAGATAGAAEETAAGAASVAAAVEDEISSVVVEVGASKGTTKKKLLEKPMQFKRKSAPEPRLNIECHNERGGRRKSHSIKEVELVRLEEMEKAKARNAENDDNFTRESKNRARHRVRQVYDQEAASFRNKESETEEMELEGDDAPEIDEDGGMERRNQRHECYFCDTFHN